MPEQKMIITAEEMEEACERLKVRSQTTHLTPKTAKEVYQSHFPNVKIDESLFDHDPLNVLHFTAEIQTQCQETRDEFIFKQVKPFCENAVRMVISKELLVRALTEYFENHPEEREPKEGVNEDV